MATVAAIGLTPPASAMTSTPAIVTRAAVGRRRVAAQRVARLRRREDGLRASHRRQQQLHGARRQPASCAACTTTTPSHCGWSDIGYNFLIDRYGTIYEGRYGGVTQGPIGAQTLGFNTNSTGVSIMGNFSNVAPPTAALTSLKRCSPGSSTSHHVDPAGTAVLTCRSGQRFALGQHVTFPAIAGHRDANFTACPGDALYSLLPSVRKAVAALGLPKIFAFGPPSQLLSPNADGVVDKAAVAFTMSEACAWHVEMRRADGVAVRHFSGQGSSASVTWGGKDDAGQSLPDGIYSVVASATSARGKARSAKAAVTIDTAAPSLKGVTLAPHPFSPNGDGHCDRVYLHYTPGERASARVNVLDGASRVVRKLLPWTPVKAVAQSVVWDGKSDATGTPTPAAEGRHTFVLTVKDAAGNARTVKSEVVLDRTLGFPTVTPATFSPNGDGVLDTTSVAFKLTRAATVRVTVQQSGSAVATVFQGALAAGSRAAEWNGRLSAGADRRKRRLQRPHLRPEHARDRAARGAVHRGSHEAAPHRAGDGERHGGDHRQARVLSA